MLSSTNLANSSTKTSRRPMDFYPTPPEVTHALMRYLELPRLTRVLEPASGDGAMAKVIAEYCPQVCAYDIREDGFLLRQNQSQDFLTETTNTDVIITNPPFNLAEQFIRHAITKAPIVAMLLKSQYWHAKTRTPLFKEHPPAFVLPLNWRPDFRNGELGGSPTMEVAWSVWMRGVKATVYDVLEKPDTRKIESDAWCATEPSPDTWANPMFSEYESDLC